MTFQVLEFSRKKIQDFPGGVETQYRSAINYNRVCHCNMKTWIVLR